MISIIILILILFSIVWFFFWFWFFRISPETLMRLYNIGNKAFDRGNYKKAKELLLKVVKQDNSPAIKYKLGVSRMELGEYKDARLLFEEVLKQSPKNFEAKFKLAEILYKEKNIQSH